MAFVDQCKIFFKAGDGGNGIVAWRREAHVPLGGPAGGDGGNGGSIIIVGDHNEHSLQNLKFLKKVVAGNGTNGQIKTMHGSNANDVYVKVPLGTVIIDLKTNQEIADISKNKQEFIICEGGKGGHGNFHFKSGFNKAPTLYELGDKGEQKECLLILKEIADVGIIGLPNAGKSTLLSKLTNAKPNIANYQFTTLNPVLGILKTNDKSIVIADIPGLIDGASQGYGLGHDFLKHIERTKLLIHVVSMSNFDNEDPYQAYEVIMKELKNYSESLLKKPMIMVANKLDCNDSEENFKNFKKKLPNEEIIPISAINSNNIDQVISRIIDEFSKTEPVLVNEEETKVISSKPKDKEDLLSKELIIHKIDDNIWDIKCDFLEYWAHKIPLNTNDNMIRFNQKMKTVEVEAKLKNLGAIKGDTIKIYNVELEYEE